MEQRQLTVRNSDIDIDFDDVFGGPPTWTKYSYSGSRTNSSEEGMGSPTRSVERSVFGEPYSSPTSYDFFHDIFRVSDESKRSPTSCSSTPGSTTLRTTKIKPFSTSPSPEFSMPTKMNKAADISVSGSNVHSQNAPLARFSSPATRTLRNNSRHSTGQNEIDHKSKPRIESARLQALNFSFVHKWANVGVPLLMSTIKGSSKVSALSKDNMQDSGFLDEDLSAVKQDLNFVSGISLMEIIEKEPSDVKLEVNKHEVIPNNIERKGNLWFYTNKAEANKIGVAPPKNRVKGMIKDFYRMSKQESPPKTKTNVSSRWKTSAGNQIQEDVAHIISNLDTHVKMMTDASKTTKLVAESVKMAPNASITRPLDSKVAVDNVKEETERSNKQKLAQNSTIRKLKIINFQKDATPATVEIIDNPSFIFKVEELTSVEDKLSKSQEESEAIMALDSKIRMWSSGRTGNIRSLLSTLQLVLWVESGWKPVALVDIIEANAVKKFYNRAMLCLHPDKLQQKGTDSHKSYIAEKVFDILQEAWDHFSSLGGTLL